MSNGVNGDVLAISAPNGDKFSFNQEVLYQLDPRVSQIIDTALQGWPVRVTDCEMDAAPESVRLFLQTAVKCNGGTLPDPVATKSDAIPDEAVIALLEGIRESGDLMQTLLDGAAMAGADPRSLALAATHLQTGAMWLTRAVKKPTGLF